MMDPREFFATGNSYYVDEDYAEAERHYTVALELEPSCQCYINRAASRLKLNNLLGALEDCNRALETDSKNDLAFYRKGVALFYSGEYENSKNAFTKALRLKAECAVYMRWIAKCDAELTPVSLAGRAGSVASHQPAAPVKKAPEAPAAPVAEVPAQPLEEPSKGDISITGRKKVKREWYQNDDYVYVTIFQKGIKKDQVDVTFEKQSFAISFPFPDSSEEYGLDLNLGAEIVPEKCRVEVGATKVEVMLKKVEPDFWASLEEAEASWKPVAYPSSNPAKKDWVTIDKIMQKDLDENKAEGDEALNNLFKQIYGNADDDTRRAMIKSFQTSGGTVLSTNWSDVKKADYEGKDRPSAPDGQEWAKR